VDGAQVVKEPLAHHRVEGAVAEQLRVRVRVELRAVHRRPVPAVELVLRRLGGPIAHGRQRDLGRHLVLGEHGARALVVVVVALEDVRAILEPVARQPHDRSTACVPSTVCMCTVRTSTVRPAQAPVLRACRSRGTLGGQPCASGYGYGTQERCYVSALGATWVLVQEWLKVVPLAAYSPVAGGRRKKWHARRPNGLDLLVV